MSAPAARLPALFVGHGNPMNAIETNPVTRAWQAAARALPQPRAVVCISAHIGSFELCMGTFGIFHPEIPRVIIARIPKGARMTSATRPPRIPHASPRIPSHSTIFPLQYGPIDWPMKPPVVKIDIARLRFSGAQLPASAAPSG